MTSTTIEFTYEISNFVYDFQVCDKKFIRSSPKLGEVYVALEEFQMGNALTNWYPLS